MNSLPLVSVIILNYNGKVMLENCLRSVLSTEYPNFEVILVDNASTDGSVEYIKDRFGSCRRLRAIRNKRNMGFALGNNVGVKIARGNYIVFLSYDTEVSPKWLKELVNTLEFDQKIGCCQSKLLLMRDRKRFDSAGGLLDYWGFALDRGNLEEDMGQYDLAKGFFFCKGAAMMVRRKVISETGLFDPKFFILHEDSDLSWRIRLKGYDIRFVPKSVVFHAASASMEQQRLPFRAFHGTKNHLSLLIKNYGTTNLLKYLPCALIVRLILSLIEVIRRNPSIAMARINAVIWVLRNARYLWHERIRVQHHIRCVSDNHVMKYMQKPHLIHFYRLYQSLIRR